MTTPQNQLFVWEDVTISIEGVVKALGESGCRIDTLASNTIQCRAMRCFLRVHQFTTKQAVEGDGIGVVFSSKYAK